MAGWSTPIVWPGSGKPQIILLGSKKLAAYDPADGAELWSVAGFPVETAPSPAFDDHQVYVGAAGMGGRSNPDFGAARWADIQRYDTNKQGEVRISVVPDSARFVLRPELPEGHPGRDWPAPLKAVLKAIDQNKDGIVTQQEWETALTAIEQMDKPVLMALRPEAAPADQRIAWQLSRGIPEVPSPLCYLGKLFLVRDGGLIQCLTADSGALLYQGRLEAGSGYAASPIAADGRVYLASELGAITVLDARAPQLTVLAQNALGEQITATPAPVQDQLYVRTEKHLFAFGSGGGR